MNDLVAKYVSQGIYTVPDVARYTSIPSRNIYAWIYGGSAVSAEKGTAKRLPTVFHQFELMEHIANLSFKDMVQIRFVDYFREQGVSLHKIRKAAGNAARLLSTTHPFCSAKFKTDGVELLAEVVEKDGDISLVELKNMQHVFRQIIDPFLQTLEYEHEVASRWWHKLGKNHIVLDPRCNFGKPTLVSSGLTTETLFEAFNANKRSTKIVADWYEIPEEDVEYAVDFETGLAA